MTLAELIVQLEILREQVGDRPVFAASDGERLVAVVTGADIDDVGDPVIRIAGW